jgi:hypothetical protein
LLHWGKEKKKEKEDKKKDARFVFLKQNKKQKTKKKKGNNEQGKKAPKSNGFVTTNCNQKIKRKKAPVENIWIVDKPVFFSPISVPTPSWLLYQLREISLYLRILNNSLPRLLLFLLIVSLHFFLIA